MLKAVEIQWDFDMDEVYERLDYMKPIEAARFLGVPFDRYERMTTEERHDYAYDVFRHCPGLLDEFMGLPDAITVPEGMTDPEDISDWLSDEYGFCHEGFQLKDVPSHPKPKKILCPSCGKELIELEPYEDNRFNAWCDDCNLSITINMDEETPVSIDNDKIRVDWYDAGEGLSGDYNPEDPDDIHLLRFDVYKKVGEDWEEVEDASYCTRMPSKYNYDGFECMPEKLIGKQYYFPGNTGYENTIKKYHEWCRNYKNKMLEANRKEN